LLWKNLLDFFLCSKKKNINGQKSFYFLPIFFGKNFQKNISTEDEKKSKSEKTVFFSMKNSGFRLLQISPDLLDFERKEIFNEDF